MNGFNGLFMGLGGLARLSRAKTRSISAENFTGEKGKGGMALEGTGAACAGTWAGGGRYRRLSRYQPAAPSPWQKSKVQGQSSIWMTCFPKYWRSLVLRMYWDGEDEPSVETLTVIFSATAGAKGATSIPCQL